MLKARPNYLRYNPINSKEMKIHDFYRFRMKVQKTEFLVIWTFILFNAVEHLLNSSHESTERQSDNESLSIALHIAIIYSKHSLLTRFLAYAVDFVNAGNRLGLIKNKSLMGFPMWLVFHHGGVFVTHCIMAQFISPQDHINAMLVLAVLQSTHNTWTKKYSKVLYWGNVLFGVVATYIYIMVNMQNAFWACTSMMVMMLVGNIGIGLLFIESMSLSLRVENND